MKTENDELLEFLSQHAGDDYCYLITKGRKSGRPHEIEIWFGVNGNALYLLSGGGHDSDWVKNLRANPKVIVKIAGYNFRADARIVTEEKEELMARHSLAKKYQGWKEGQSLSEWGRTGLAVVIELDSKWK